MRHRIAFATLALAVCSHEAARAQQVPGLPPADSVQGRMMSGVIRPTRPAIVFMGFGWRHRTGEPYRVSQVQDDSPASRAGLMVGDALLAVDGHDPTEDGVMFRNNAPGRHYRLRVQRGDQELELEIISAPPRPNPAPAPAPAP
jgi:predicted metalloprotease with PDZ domain